MKKRKAIQGKIVIINQWASHLTKDIVNAFTSKFDEVALISGYASQSGRSLNDKVKTTRIVRYNKKNVFTRTMSWFIASIQLIFLVNTKYRKYHLFITSNPPTAAFLPRFCRNSYSVQILDIHPDALVAGGFIKEKSWINRKWRKQNEKYFEGATNLFTITNGMARTMSQYCDREKIQVISQWPPSIGYQKIERQDNKFLQEHSIEDKFIVMYSGNIGLGHHVEVLVDVAREIKDRDDILFAIIGEGFNKPLVERKIKEYELKNCLVLPFQPTDMFIHSSQAGNIGVVSASKELAALMVPIKAYNIINNQIPLLCITEGDSELSSLVSNYNIGQCFTPTDIKEIAQYIIKLKENPAIIEEYKINLQECSKNFTAENAYSYVDVYSV